MHGPAIAPDWHSGDFSYDFRVFIGATVAASELDFDYCTECLVGSLIFSLVLTFLGQCGGIFILHIFGARHLKTPNTMGDGWLFRSILRLIFVRDG